MSEPLLYAEHPQDVLQQWLTWRRSGPAALVVVTSTEGGSVRAPGALMAVSGEGQRCGYISGGCVDADVALRAQHCLASGTMERIRYGAGSPFIDMPLPCGGAIDIAILPDAPYEDLNRCHAELAARRPFRLILNQLQMDFRYTPKLRIRIAGRGADALALARLAITSGYNLTLQLRRGEDINEAVSAGFQNVVSLDSASSIPECEDDPWTAFVLMFHDPDWESALLKQALSGPAFYIGAVGSRRTQERRRTNLISNGISVIEAERVRGPIGLVPSMRNASMLAVSVLSEIIESFSRLESNPFARTALVMLAAGASARFGGPDKLLADLEGLPLLAHSAALLPGKLTAARIAVIGPGQQERRKILESAGWRVIENEMTQAGQATSLHVGIEAAAGIGNTDSAMIVLADMPRISDRHIETMQDAMSSGAPAVMSRAGEILCPPALVSREAFPALLSTSGDRGARHMLAVLPGLKSVQLPADQAIDIDTPDDLARASMSAKA